jgi:uncharacterized protein YndB with AHSA1/START domain
VTELALDLEFELPCTPEAAFRAWTEAAAVTVWWGEDGVYRTTGWSADVRAGGTWRAAFEGDGGEGFGAEGRYLEVERPSRLVWTWSASWAPEAETRIDMTFAPREAGTLMRLRQSGFDSAEDRADNETAWRQMAGWLTAHLEAG